MTTGFGACGRQIMAIRRQMIHDGCPVAALTREQMEAQIEDLKAMNEPGEMLWDHSDDDTIAALDCIYG